MQVVLRPMIEEIYLAYLSQHEQAYARDRMITDRESLEDALRTTRAQHQALLPQGLLTPNNHFYTVEDETRNERVGSVWIAYCPEKARELGCRAIWLNVMAHNQSGIDFYLAQGDTHIRFRHCELNSRLRPEWPALSCQPLCSQSSRSRGSRKTSE
jgi:GNAT superfamily N-acetyltransferase